MILIVDPDPQARDVMERICQGAGVKTRTAVGWEAGLAILRLGGIHVVVADVARGEWAGVISAIRVAAPRVSILIWTDTPVTPEQVRWLHGQGVADVVAKDLTLAQVEQRLSVVYRQAKRALRGPSLEELVRSAAGPPPTPPRPPTGLEESVNRLTQEIAALRIGGDCE